MGSSVSLVLRVHADTGVVNSGELSEEFYLSFTVVFTNNSLLVGVKRKHSTFLFAGEVRVSGGSLGNFFVEDGHEGVVLVSHNSITDSVKGRLESSIHDSRFLGGISHSFSDFSERSLTDSGQEFLEVSLFVLGDRGEHVVGSRVHVSFEGVSGVLEVVNKSSLLDEFVFLVDTDVLHLGLSVN